MMFNVASASGVEPLRAPDIDSAIDAVIADRSGEKLGDRVIWSGVSVVAIVHPRPGESPRVTQP